jgi:acetyl-CoA/propionyl-CoA carboxylase carboxyl transferase subunit
MGTEGCRVILTAYEHALAKGAPVIGLAVRCTADRGYREPARCLRGLRNHDAASGRIPQISLVLGPVARGGAYGSALTDVVVLGPDSRMFVTGPDVVRSVTGEDVDLLQLGGPEPRGRRSGVVHVVAGSTEAAYNETRRLARLLGDQGTMNLGAISDADFGALLPDSPKRVYDVHPIVVRPLDAGPSVELHATWAPNIVTTLGRLGGRTVGVLANNPLRLGGCLDSAGDSVGALIPQGKGGTVRADVRRVRGTAGRGGRLALPGVGQERDGVVGRSCCTPSPRRPSRG